MFMLVQSTLLFWQGIRWDKGRGRWIDSSGMFLYCIISCIVFNFKISLKTTTVSTQEVAEKAEGGSGDTGTIPEAH